MSSLFQIIVQMVVRLYMVNYLTARNVDYFQIPMLYVTFKYSVCSFPLAMLSHLCKARV
jgi:hypothetical protein